MKKTIFIVALICASFSLFAQAPSWAWAKSPGFSGDISNSVTSDLNGNIYITGSFGKQSFITFGGITLTSAGKMDMYIVKYDQNGNVIWAKSSGGSSDDVSTSVCTDSSGNVFVVGFFSSSSITFGSTKLLNSGTVFSLFITKYDSNGNVLWAKSAGEGDLSIYSTVSSISTDVFGNAILTGGFDSQTITFGGITLTNSDLDGLSDVFLVKYDPSGNVLWAKSAVGTINGDDQGKSVSTDNSGNILITGEFSSTAIQFGGTTLKNSDTSKFASSNDIFLAKYDPSGNVLWAKSATGLISGSEDFSNSITTDKSDNVIITGSFESDSIKFGGITLKNTKKFTTADDIFLVKYDKNGNVIWAKSKGGSMLSADVGTSVKTDAFDNIVTTGSIFDPYQNIYVSKYDSYGNLLWSISPDYYRSTQNNFEPVVSRSVTFDKFGNILVTGNFDAFISFGSTKLGSTGTPVSSSIFVAKLSSTVTVGLETSSTDAGMLVSPNPFNNSTLIQLPEVVNNAEIIVIDLSGKKVLSERFIGKEYILEKGKMSPGVYFVHINDEQHQYPVTKIVVQ